jgi:hypothetical protein
MKHQVPVFIRELTTYYRKLQQQNSDLLYLIKFNLTYSTHLQNRARNAKSIRTDPVHLTMYTACLTCSWFSSTAVAASSFGSLHSH